MPRRFLVKVCGGFRYPLVPTGIPEEISGRQPVYWRASGANVGVQEPTSPMKPLIPRIRAASGIVALIAVSTNLAAADSNPPAPATSADQTITMNPFNVSSAGDRGYATVNSVGANMVDTPILDTSFSIVAFNHQFMSDVLATDPVVAAQWASGVIGASNGYGIGQATIRGQNVTNNTRDGVVDLFGSGGVAPYDGDLFERIEIIKGPIGTMYGDYSGQGGLMNMVTKAPEAHNFGSLAFVGGSDDEGGLIYREVLDVNQVDPSNRNLEGRIVIIGQNGTNIQRAPDTEFAVMPMAILHTPGGGNLLLRYTYQNPDRTAQGGDWTYDSNLNISYFINKRGSDDALNNGFNMKNHSIDVDFEQPFKTGIIDWAGRAYVRYNHFDFLRQEYSIPAAGDNFYNAQGQLIGTATTLPFNAPGLATITTGTQVSDVINFYEQSINENVDFVGRFDLGPTKNTLLIYGALLNEELNSTTTGGTFGNPMGITVWSIAGLPVFNYPNPIPYPTNLVEVTNTEAVTSLWSEGAQENMSLFNDKLILTVGFREDVQKQTTVNYITPKSSDYGDIRPGTSRKYGVVFAPWSGIRVFYNYSTTFTPNGSSSDVFGVTYKLPNLAPITNEVGIKTDLFRDRLMVTASWFYTVVDNETVVATQFNPITGNSGSIEVPAGRAVIKGYEADGTFAITNNLDMIFGWGSLTSVSQLGLYGRNVPFGVNYRAFLKYSFGLPTNPWAVGFGVLHDGPAAANSTDTANIPPYTVCDGFISYRISRHWKAQVNVNNIFNANYLALAIATTQGQGSNPTDAALEIAYSW